MCVCVCGAPFENQLGTVGMNKPTVYTSWPVSILTESKILFSFFLSSFFSLSKVDDFSSFSFLSSFLKIFFLRLTGTSGVYIIGVCLC